jgi:hypothetical protein
MVLMWSSEFLFETFFSAKKAVDEPWEVVLCEKAPGGKAREQNFW